MLRLYIKDNVTGKVHEYGTDRHDSLILQEDGSIHYLNLQNGTGTRFSEEGYSFCLEDGSDPRKSEMCERNGLEPFLNIGGD